MGIEAVSCDGELASFHTNGGEIARLVYLRTEIYAAIQQVTDRDVRRVLHLRYMGYRSWSAIAEEMKLSLRQIYRLHGEGLKNFRFGHRMSLNGSRCPLDVTGLILI